MPLHVISVNNVVNSKGGSYVRGASSDDPTNAGTVAVSAPAVTYVVAMLKLNSDAVNDVFSYAMVNCPV